MFAGQTVTFLQHVSKALGREEIFFELLIISTGTRYKQGMDGRNSVPG
jgi:hypothetical protein